VFGREVERSWKWPFLVLGALLVYVLASSVAISAVELVPPPPGAPLVPADAAPVHWPFWQACRFTITNVTMVGFGDLLPRSASGKAIAAVNALVGFVSFGAIAAAWVLALSPVQYAAVPHGEGGPSRLASPREPLGNDDALALALSGLGFILRESALGDADRPRGEPLAEWRERSFAYVISDRQEIEIIVRSR
jgi:hypothetical protein